MEHVEEEEDGMGDTSMNSSMEEEPDQTGVTVLEDVKPQLHEHCQQAQQAVLTVSNPLPD